MIDVSGVVPLVVYAVLVPLLIWRGRRRGTASDVLVAQLVLGAWVAAVVALTLFPLPWPTGPDRPVVRSDPRHWPMPWASVTPLATIGMSLREGFASAEGRVLIGNLVAFVPLGFLAPILGRRWRSALRILLLGVAASAAVELAQLGWDLVVGMPWRSADIDDVIVNAAGTVLGYVGWRVASVALAGRRAPISAS
jgi:glycopeptide antibiotics resistance protein